MRQLGPSLKERDPPLSSATSWSTSRRPSPRSSPSTLQTVTPVTTSVSTSRMLPTQFLPQVFPPAVTEVTKTINISVKLGHSGISRMYTHDSCHSSSGQDLDVMSDKDETGFLLIIFKLHLAAVWHSIAVSSVLTGKRSDKNLLSFHWEEEVHLISSLQTHEWASS